MFSFKRRKSSSELISSALFDEKNFYQTFFKDLESSQKEVVIESPYTTASRMEGLYPIFEKLLRRGVKIYIITRDPIDHEDEYMRHQATNEILYCQEIGINVILLKGFHHRKLAIIDQKILWEGSLNILSQIKSLEIMRRTESKNLVVQMLKFLKLGKLL